MSRKSVPKRSSLSRSPAVDVENSDEHRLDLEKIVDIDPWKDIEKYDNQEAGQIQQVLLQFNDMVLNDKKNKRRSVRKSRASNSSPKATSSKEAVEEESSKVEKMRNDKIQHGTSETSVNDTTVVILENICRENSSDNQKSETNTVEEKEEELEEMKEKSSKAINRVERKSIGSKRASASSMKPIASSKAAEGQSIGKQQISKENFQYRLLTSVGDSSIIDVEVNISLDYERNDEITDSFEEDEEKLDEKREKTISEAVAEKNDADNTSAGRRQSIQRSVSPMAPRNDQSRNRDAIELPIDEPSYDDSSMQRETIIAGQLRNQSSGILNSADTAFEKSDPDSQNKGNSALKRAAANSVMQSSTMKTESPNAEPDKGKIAECKNNKYKSKRARKQDEKMVKAFDKFGKQFVKYSNTIKNPRYHETGPIDVSFDSESDSSSDSSDSDESSSSCSFSSSRCSCCSSSSHGSSSYTSCSDTTSAVSCSCSACSGDDEYSEYTLASSVSTHSGSDGSTDSSTD